MSFPIFVFLILQFILFIYYVDLTRKRCQLTNIDVDVDESAHVTNRTIISFLGASQRT